MVSKQLFGEGVQFVFRLEVKFPFILRKVPEKYRQLSEVLQVQK